jgi:hypothetical protein
MKLKVKDVGDAALVGWREKAAGPVARKAPLRDEYVRAALGLLFLALSIRHLAETARRLRSR